MPAVKFFTRLDLDQIILFLDGHQIVPIQEWEHGDTRKAVVQALKIIQLIAVLLAACILGNWYLVEYKKARAANLPSYRAYFSLPGICIIVLMLLLPFLARMIQK